MGEGSTVEREKSVLEKLRQIEKAGFGAVYVQIRDGKIVFIKQEINEQIE